MRMSSHRESPGLWACQDALWLVQSLDRLVITPSTLHVRKWSLQQLSALITGLVNVSTGTVVDVTYKQRWISTKIGHNLDIITIQTVAWLYVSSVTRLCCCSTWIAMAKGEHAFVMCCTKVICRTSILILTLAGYPFKGSRVNDTMNNSSDSEPAITNTFISLPSCAPGKFYGISGYWHRLLVIFFFRFNKIHW